MPVAAGYLVWPWVGSENKHAPAGARFVGPKPAKALSGPSVREQDGSGCLSRLNPLLYVHESCLLPLAYVTEPAWRLCVISCVASYRCTAGPSIDSGQVTRFNASLELSMFSTHIVRSNAQVLVSIQSLIFVADPYFNEPGYECQLGTAQVG